MGIRQPRRPSPLLLVILSRTAAASGVTLLWRPKSDRPGLLGHVVVGVPPRRLAVLSAGDGVGQDTPEYDARPAKRRLVGRAHGVGEALVLGEAGDVGGDGGIEQRPGAAGVAEERFAPMELVVAVGELLCVHRRNSNLEMQRERERERRKQIEGKTNEKRMDLDWIGMRMKARNWRPQSARSIYLVDVDFGLSID